uniref:Ig-like domain-containing protein n=1 Tax=Sparus aurata TaxID=8175 RepID=A0A671TQN7_SPAAU
MYLMTFIITCSCLLFSFTCTLVGDDVLLPCHLEPAVNGRLLFEKQNPSFFLRTRVFLDELQRGNVSMKIFSVKLSDAGTYKCSLPAMKKEADVQLIVGTSKGRMGSFYPAISPLTTFEWKLEWISVTQILVYTYFILFYSLLRNKVFTDDTKTGSLIEIFVSPGQSDVIGFHSTVIVIIAVIAVIAVITASALVIYLVLFNGKFLKNRKISKSHISSLFISPVCLKTLLQLITFKTTLYSDRYLLFLFGHYCHKNKSQLSVTIDQM